PRSRDLRLPSRLMKRSASPTRSRYSQERLSQRWENNRSPENALRLHLTHRSEDSARRETSTGLPSKSRSGKRCPPTRSCSTWNETKPMTTEATALQTRCMPDTSAIKKITGWQSCSASRNTPKRLILPSRGLQAERKQSSSSTRATSPRATREATSSSPTRQRRTNSHPNS
ncbi:hypothetical protein GGH91_005570, partial [Coemansia sp. RSA 2671]